MISVNSDDQERDIRKKIVSLLKNKFPLITDTDFNFVKVIRKTVHDISLGPDVKINLNTLKQFAGQPLP